MQLLDAVRVQELSPEAETSGAALAPVAEIPDEGSNKCLVTVKYLADLGSGSDSSEVALNPILVNTVQIDNNEENVDIRSWRLGWNFPHGTVIKSSQDIFQAPYPGPALISKADIPGVVLESKPGQNMSIDYGDTLQFGFVATKDPRSLKSDTNTSFGVGPPMDMAFNNLVCSLATVGSDSISAAPDATPGTSVSSPTNISIEYAPIEYVDQPLQGPSTQFLVR